MGYNGPAPLPILPIGDDIVTYIVPWDDRVAFVDRIIGRAGGRIGLPLQHPKDSEKYASDVKVTLTGGGTARVGVTFREPNRGHRPPLLPPFDELLRRAAIKPPFGLDWDGEDEWPPIPDHPSRRRPVRDWLWRTILWG